MPKMENERTIELIVPMIQYVKAVERRLNLPRDVRERVMCDFITSIVARKENGETYDEIKESLGTPKKAAADINAQMVEYTFRKSPWRYLFLIVSILTGVWLAISVFVQAFLMQHLSHSIGVIGGADGPTSIFVTASVNHLWIEIVVALALLIICLFLYHHFGHLKRKK